MEIEFQLYQEYTGKSPVVGHEFSRLSRGEKLVTHGRNAEIMLGAASATHHAAVKDIGGYWEIANGVAADLWLPSLEDRLEHVKALKKLAADDFYIFGTVYFPLRIPWLGDLTEYSVRLFEAPEEIRAESERRFREACDVQDRLLEAGADGIINDCDVACNTGPLLSPEMMDDFLFPYVRRWAEKCSDQGVFSVWHSDGNLGPLMDRILASRIGALHSIDPTAGMEITELKRMVGPRLTLIGAIDCSLLHLGTPDRIYTQTTRILRGCSRAATGGHIFSACNTIFSGIPKENYDAVIEARLDFDRSLRNASGQ